MAEEKKKGKQASLLVNRRSFMKWSAALGGTAALCGPGVFSKVSEAAAQSASGTEEAFWTSCTVNCGSRCVLKAYVKDGVIVRMDTDDTGDDAYGSHQVRACLRGRSKRHQVYNPDRLKYPMKRTGIRGEGKFERISWDQAFKEIAQRLKQTVDTYGNESVFINYGTGTLGAVMSKSWHPSTTCMARLMNTMGGYLNQYGDYSAGQLESALPPMFGDGWVTGNSFRDIANSRLVVFFGNNPAATRMSGGGLVYDLVHSYKENRPRFITIDPRYTDTASVVGDEWIPIRPGTDAALINGLAYVLITENMVDQEFLDKCTIGYDEDHMPRGIPANNSYKSYILGKGEDKTPKTVKWASEITGIPEARIIKLARELGTTKPAFIVQGWGPQRHSNGEQNSRAVCTLAALTGNIGIQGGNTGARESGVALGFVKFPMGKNKVKATISHFTWPMAIERGSTMTAKNAGVRGAEKLGADLKFMWNYAGNCIINQHSDVNATTKMLQDDKKLETIVVIDSFMTPSAKFADYLLPGTTTQEENDFSDSYHVAELQYLSFVEKAIEPQFESRNIYDICAGVAKELGPDIEQAFTEGRTRDQWLEWLYRETRKKYPGLPPTLAEAYKLGVYKEKRTGLPRVPYKKFREDPKNNPLKTPSGKIEIFCKYLHDAGQEWELKEDEKVTGLPIYDTAWEGHTDPLISKYPLQLIGHHYKQRTHSTFGNVDWTNQVAPQLLWINPIDAKTRSIKHGDLVEIFNDRGKVRIEAKVTDRIMPGVLSLPEGAWYRPDKEMVDHGGCVNVLTLYRPTALAKSNPQHSNLVQVVKV